MADDVTTDKSVDEKLQAARLADAQRRVDGRPPIVPDDKLQSGPISLEPGSVPGGFVSSSDPPREVPAAERLRAFEDEHLGKDAVRIGGRIERGYGSPFAGLSDEKKRQYAALEKLVVAEQKLADAHAALIQAEADHEAALAAAEPKPDAHGPTVAEYVAAGYLAVNYPPSGYASRSTREEIDAAIAKQKADGRE